MEALGYLFPIAAAFVALRFWNTEYKSLSLIFAGDFVVIFSVVQLWIESSLPPGVWFLPDLGVVYILLFGAYLLTKSLTGYILSGMSAVIGILHCANPTLGLFTLGNYESLMAIYCICQFLVFFGGMSYELYHRNIPINTWFNPHCNWHKGA